MYLSPARQFVQARRSVLLVFAILACFGDLSAQDFKTVHGGVDYAEVTREIGGQPVRMNLLRLDLKKVRLDVMHAGDAAIGMETTSSIASRHNAVAAINSGFFRLDKSIYAGDAVGTLMIDGELLSESTNNRIALRILNEKKSTSVAIERSIMNAWFGFGDLHSQVKLAGVDRESKGSEFILFGPAFGKTTLVKASGTDIVLTKCARVVKKKKLFVRCQDASIVDNAANSTIPADGYVVSLGTGESKSRTLLLNDLKLYRSDGSAKHNYFIRFEDQVSQLPIVDEDAVAGVPQLIKDGKADVTWEQEKSSKSFVETRHPRTAVAKLKDGKFLAVTVDGRSESSGGISLNDLAEYLLELGAMDAMNLD